MLTADTWVSTGPGIRVVAHHSVEPVGAGSRATLSLELQGVFGRVFGPPTKTSPTIPGFRGERAQGLERESGYSSVRQIE